MHGAARLSINHDTKTTRGTNGTGTGTKEQRQQSKNLATRRTEGQAMKENKSTTLLCATFRHRDAKSESTRQFLRAHRHRGRSRHPAHPHTHTHTHEDPVHATPRQRRLRSKRAKQQLTGRPEPPSPTHTYTHQSNAKATPGMQHAERTDSLCPNTRAVACHSRSKTESANIYLPKTRQQQCTRHTR